ncbi:MAG: DUF1659 domain-containing protein [Syntrophomonadaceae bacterium]|nr:DUF1659 domain-containing protein [Syntrophomonadaceae bacterium]
MAISSTPLGADMILVMDNGIGASGQQLVKNRVYSDVRSDATDDDLYSVAQSLLGLQEQTALAVQRRNLVEIQDV